MFEVSFELLRRSTAASVAQEDVLRSVRHLSDFNALSLSAFVSRLSAEKAADRK
jgi:hypothetical protein